jgi:hypothetical protein
MRIQVAAIISWVAAVSLAGQASGQTMPSQFDLICKGREQNGASAPMQDHEVRYRIDLTERRWCSDACPAGIPIVDVTADRITLEKRGDPLSRGAVISHVISRVDGTVRVFGADPSALWLYRFTGACEAAPFSGFPKSKF